MQKRTTMMGTACVLAAATLTASPAAAAALTDFAGFLNTTFSNADNSEQGSDTVKSWLLNGSIAAPLSDIPNMNFQLDAGYTHNWGDHFSREDWNFGGSAFWADNDGRIGINASYSNFNSVGHLTNGGVFAEWYFGPITVMGKGGWLSGGGTSFGGHGNYLGAGVSGYVLPNLAITGGVDWADVVMGQGCQTCGRGDARATTFEILAEFLFSDELGLSGYAGYQYQSNKFGQVDDTHDNIWRVGLRWYTGGGSLMDRHRNGTLNPWLPGLPSASSGGS